MAGDPTRLAEEIGTALINWARSSSVKAETNPTIVVNTPSEVGDIDTLARKIAFTLSDFTFMERSDEQPKRVIAEPDDTIVFDRDNPKLDLELPRLRNILENAAKHSEWLHEYVKDYTVAMGDPRSTSRRKKFTALRLSATMRDSLGQMARLVAGEDLDEEVVEHSSRPEFVQTPAGERTASYDEVDDDVSPLALSPLSPTNHVKVDALATAAQLREAEIYRRIKRVAKGIKDDEDLEDLEAILSFIRDSNGDNRLVSEIRRYAMMGGSTTSLRKTSAYFRAILDLIDGTETNDEYEEGEID